MPSDYERIVDGLFTEPSTSKPAFEEDNDYEETAGKLFDNDEARYNQSKFVATRKDPTVSTEAMKLSEEFKLPLSFVERNMDSLKKKKKEQFLSYENIVNKSPALARWMEKPDYATIAQDDINNLEKVEGTASKIKPYIDKPAYVTDLAEAGGTGFDNLTTSVIHLSAAYGLVDIEDNAPAIAELNKRVQEAAQAKPAYAKEFDQVMAEEGADVDRAVKRFTGSFDKFKNDKILEGLVDFAAGGGMTVAQVIDQVGQAVIRPKAAIRSMTESLAFSVPSLVTGYAGAQAGATAGGAAGSFVAPGPGTAVGAGIGGVAGFVGGSFVGSAATEVGAWMNSSLIERGYDVTDPKSLISAYNNKKLMAELRLEAERKGLTTAGVDALFAAVGGKFLKGAKGAGRVAVAKAAVKDVGVQALGEATSEAAGQIAAREGDLSRVNFGEAVTEGVVSLGHSIGDTVIGGSMRGEFSQDTVVATEEIVEETAKAVNTLAELDSLERLGDIAKESKVNERSPEAFGELIDQSIQADDVQSVYFQSDKWDEYWLAQGESPVAKAEELLSDGGQSYATAKETGQPIEVPVKEFVSKVGPQDTYNELLQIAQVQPDGMVAQEAQEFVKNLPKTVEEVAQEAKEYQARVKVVDEQMKAIKSDVEQQLVEQGVDKLEAVPLLEFYRATALREGKTPEQIIKQFPLTITGEQAVSDIAMEAAQGREFYQKVSKAPEFYSKLQKTLGEKIQGKSASSQQIQGLIKDLKPEEIEWSGINQFLKGKKKVDKQELMDFLKANELNIEPVVLGEPLEGIDTEREYTYRIWAGDNDVEAYAESYEDAEAKVDELIEANPDTTREDWPIQEVQADEEFEMMAGEDIAGPTKYQEYTLPGGENYREILYTLPAEQKKAVTYRVLDPDGDRVDEFNNRQDAEDKAKEVDGTVKEMDYGTVPVGETYKTSHFDQENILAHVRLKDRVDKDGNKVLFVEEIQSDWHQEGRKKGYVSDQPEKVDVNQLKKEAEDIKESLIEEHVTNITLDSFEDVSERGEDRTDYRGINGDRSFEVIADDRGNAVRYIIYHDGASLENIKIPKGESQEVLNEALLRVYLDNVDIKDLKDKIPEAEYKKYEDANNAFIEGLRVDRDRGAAVPDAPFKKTWHEFAMKNIMRMAVEGNYDKIAWTTGEQQADRFDLSKKVDQIAYAKNEDGTYRVSVDVIGADSIIRNNLSEDQASELIGKELVDKMKAEEGSRTTRNGIEHRILEGENLKVGGEGMKGFYDKMLVKYANKIGKKFKSKVQPGEVLISKDRDVVTREYPEYTVAEVIQKQESLDLTEDQNKQLQNVIDAMEDDGTSFGYEADAYIVDKDLMEMMGAKSPEGADASANVHSMPVTDKLKEFIQGEGFSLFQDDKRGKIIFGAGGEANIQLLKGADKSTFFHETGHYFLNVMQRMVEAGDASQELQDDFKGILDWLGVESADQITTEHHETWARGFEQYLREGKAPTSKLRKAFNTFRVWLTSIYKNAEELRVELSDEVRDIMDRLVATEDEINAAKQSTYDVPMFTDPLTSGMSKSMSDQYALTIAASEITAKERLAKRLMADREKKLKLNAKEIKKQVTKEVNLEPRYNTISILRNGKMADGSPLPEETIPMKMSRSEFETLYPQFKGNTNFRGMFSKDNATSIDIVASTMGYDNTDSFVVEIANTPNKKEYINFLTAQELNEISGDLLNKDDISEEAEKMVHNQDRSDRIRMEYDYLATNNKSLAKEITRRVVKRPAPQKQIKELAKTTIKSAKVNEIKPNTYRLAERRYAREAGKALAKGDIAAAFDAKEKELLNFELYRESVEARDRIKKETKAVKRFFQKDEKLAKTRDMDFISAARAILARYNLGNSKKMPLEHIEKIKEYNPDAYETIASIITGVVENPDDYNNVSFGQFEDLMDSVNALWHLSREIKTIEVDGKKVEVNKAVDDLSEYLEVFRRETPKSDYNKSLDDWEKFKVDLLGVKAIVRRFEHWVDVMDMGEITGPFRRYLFKSTSEATDKFIEANRDVREKIIELSEPIRKDINLKDAIKAPEINFEFNNKAELLGALLHTGNIGNLKKLLVGREWGTLDEEGNLMTSQWDQFIDRMVDEGVLTEADFDYIQGLWDIMEGIKPDAQKAHRKIFGFYFDEITANPFERFGKTYRGGYAPAKVDPYAVTDIARRQELEEFIKGHSSYTYPASGGRGFTKSRVDNFNKPLNLDIGLVTKHVEDVLRFSIVKPAVVDAAKVVMSQEFKQAMGEVDPVVIDKMVKPALNRADKNTAQIVDETGSRLMKQWGNMLKANASMQLMFFNVINTAEQFGGLGISATRISPRYLMRAAYRFMMNPKGVSQDSSELSRSMRTRLDEQIFEIHKNSQNIFSEKSNLETMREWAQKHVYFMQVFTQNIVDNITWAGSYDESIAKGMNQADAIEKADADVRMTQSSRRPMDISNLETNATLTFFQMFMNFFNMMANINASNFTKLYYQDMDMKSKVKKGMYMYAMGFAIVAIVSGALRKAASGHLDEDDDDEYIDDLFDVFIGSQVDLATAMIPVAGQAINAGINQANDKWYDDRVSASPALSAISTITGTAAKTATGKVFDDKNPKGDVRDALTAMGIITGLPLRPVSKPIGYMMDVRDDKAKPSGPIDFTRGLITGK